MKFVKILFALIAVAVLFKFNLDNKELANVVLYHYTSPQVPIGLLLMTTLVLGMIAASFASTLKIMQLKRQINKLQPDGVVAPEKEKKKNKKEKKGEEQPVTQQTADSSNQQSAAVVVPPVVAPSVATVSDLDENVSDAVFEDDATVVTEEEASPQVIELPHDNLQDISSTDKQ